MLELIGKERTPKLWKKLIEAIRYVQSLKLGGNVNYTISKEFVNTIDKQSLIELYNDLCIFGYLKHQQYVRDYREDNVIAWCESYVLDFLDNSTQAKKAFEEASKPKRMKGHKTTVPKLNFRKML